MNALLERPQATPIPSPIAKPQPSINRPTAGRSVPNFDPPVLTNRRGQSIPVETVSIRRKRMTRLGNMVVAVVGFSAVSMLTFGASSLMARVRMEGVRNQGISAMNRSKAAIASMDEIGKFGQSDLDLNRWATVVGFADASVTQVAYARPAAPKPYVNGASMIAAGPSVKVIRVAAR